jgi:ankyrin repeat protein
MLLASGADPSAVDPEGGTPLQYAASRGKIEVVQALLAGGANVRANSPDGYSVLHAVAVNREVRIAELLLAAGADVNARTTNNTTPLMASVCSPYSESKMSLTLIRAGADVNIVSSDGETALSCATAHDVAEELLKRGANPNIQSTRFSGETPLHKAAFNGDEETVELLLRYGADPTIRNYNGETPLDITNVKYEGVRRLLSSRSNDGH